MAALLLVTGWFPVPSHVVRAPDLSRSPRSKMTDDLNGLTPAVDETNPRLLDVDDHYRSVGRLPEPAGIPLREPDAPLTPCKSWCWALVSLLLVVPVVLALLLSIVPLLLFQILGLCLASAPPLLSSSGGTPRRPQSCMPGTDAIVLRDGRQLEYATYGPADGEPAVFVHGYGCCATMFGLPYFQAVFVAHNLRVYAVSMPGSGLSDAAPHHRGWGCWRRQRVVGRNLSEFCDDIRELAEQVIQPNSNAASADMMAASTFWVCGFSMGAAHAAAVAAALPDRVRGVGIFGPTDPHAGDPYDCGCCCCERRAHRRWQGPPGCFSMVRLASFCRPLILTPAADTLFLLLIWLFLGNGQLEKRLRALNPPVTATGQMFAKLYRTRGLGPNFDGSPQFLDHALCHSSLSWIWGLRVICSDWPCELKDIAAVGGGTGRVLVGTAIDDIICAPPNARYIARQIPGAMLYESKQLWGHDFMIVEIDKLLRILLGDGIGLDLPDGSEPFMSSRAVMSATKGFREKHGREPTEQELRALVDALTLPRNKCGVTADGGGSASAQQEQEIMPQQMAIGV